MNTRPKMSSEFSLAIQIVVLLKPIVSGNLWNVAVAALDLQLARMTLKPMMLERFSEIFCVSCSSRDIIINNIFRFIFLEFHFGPMRNYSFRLQHSFDENKLTKNSCCGHIVELPINMPPHALRTTTTKRMMTFLWKKLMMWVNRSSI